MPDASDFSSLALAVAFNREDVTNQRLLRGAVACLGLAIVAHAFLRQRMAALFRCFQATMTAFDDYIKDKYDKKQ